MEIKDNEDKTYIQISKKVRKKLNKLKVAPRESYEDVLRRLLKMPKRMIKEE